MCKASGTIRRMTKNKPTSIARAHELLAQLDEPIRYINDDPVTPLTNASAEAIAMAALAYAVLDLTDHVSALRLGLAST